MKGQAGVSGIPGKRGYKVHLNARCGYVLQVLVLTILKGEFYSPFCSFKPEWLCFFSMEHNDTFCEHKIFGHSFEFIDIVKLQNDKIKHHKSDHTTYAPYNLF